MAHEPDTQDSPHLRRAPAQPAGDFNYGFSPAAILKASEQPKTEEQRAMVACLGRLPREILQQIMPQIQLRGYVTGAELIKLKEQYAPGAKL